MAERSIYTIISRAYILLQATSGLSKELWAEIINTVVYLINRFFTKALFVGIILYERFYSSKLSYKYLRTLSCAAYAFNPYIKIAGKMISRSEK